MKMWVFLCLFVGLTHANRVRKVAMPTELRNVMADVNSLDSFLRVVNAVKLRAVIDELRIHSRGNKAEIPSQLASVLQDSDLPHVILNNAPCAPRPEVIEVPQPKNENAFYFPFFVTLHRCGGSCNARPFETNCQLQAKEDFNLLVSKTSWSSSSDRLNETSYDIAAVRMTNHSSCSCQCKVKPSDCDNRTQSYSKEHCRCDCRKRFMRCPQNYRWDPIKCQCTCSPSNAVLAECTKRVEFDMETCRCTCSKKRCKPRAKVRDPKTCRCKCPKCPQPRMRQNLQSCTCTHSIRKFSKLRRRYD
ncbi:balbiani ring protein 3-like isoform X2 [Stylophora pistillata]|uniref:balbiani ring protein 3-like isoform X2 n=1 Tax=Stylophora pistillata TaxID=50429 RepID=UPI000C03B9FF|nr:balbiani ring protein 3-like isoform X2 [Stylophora pistillata]